MLSSQSQLLKRNLDLFENGKWLFINPADAYFSDELTTFDVTFLYQYFDVFSESVRVIPSCEFDSRDVSSAANGFCIEQKAGLHRHMFSPFIKKGESYTDILIYLPKSKAHAIMLISMAHAALSDDGRLHIVGENKGGIKSIGKAISHIGTAHKVDSARHCSLITLTPNAKAQPFNIDDWLDESAFEVDGFNWQVVSLPGVFSHGELDEGTRLLLEKCSHRMRGKVLDFACGAGVIGSCLLGRFPHIELTLLDVSALALYCAAKTLATNNQSANLIAANGLHGVSQKFTHIVTNPPFHTGVKTDYTITRRFIADSAKCLASKGTVQLVANRFLPYPGLLADVFPSTHTVAQNSQFSVYLSVSA
ncbi:class I SAM-dependent methyltransferase [Alteromonas sp. C1M14]|uniref:class I SAM-dependent methyltransferase n=1 Tax=Alteromonas sp. C1M14 TaxID=2841567 RepID=UPI001C083316|nr:class I SAM-dependent methyltransferase [Alteromonas sp. C1M14]MBU2978509.1 class I SAM-dependent methyltransferase [Alteromonas sp. C1M14]